MQNLTISFNKISQKNWFCLSGIFLACILTILFPFYLLGFPYGNPDLEPHIRFAINYQDAILRGDLFPGWVPDNLGFGSIGIRFYPPLSSFILALTGFVIGNWYDALTLNVFGWMLVGCIGVYYFVKEWINPTPAMLAGILYAVVPYHLMQIYQQFLFAEFAAMGILPFCFLFITRICQKENRIDTFLFAVSFGLLILIHIPSTIISVISLGLYGLLIIDWKHYKRTFTHLIFAIVLGISATSYHWIKIVTELQWLTHNDERFFTGVNGYTMWVFPLTWLPHIIELHSIYSFMWDTTIILTVLLLIPSIIYLIVHKNRSDKKNEYSLIWSMLITSLFVFFMTTKASSVIWENVTFIRKLQFPWRWLSVLSFLAVVVFIISLNSLIKTYKNWTRLFVYPALVLVLVIFLFNWTQIIKQSNPISRTEFTEFADNIPNSLNRDYWLPIWANFKEIKNSESIKVENRGVNIGIWGAENKEFTIEKGNPVSVRIATLYYPYWKAKINNQPTEIKLDDNGLMLIDIPAEQSKVRLYFEEPLIVTFCWWASLAIWIYLFSVLIIFYRKQKFRLLCF